MKYIQEGFGWTEIEPVSFPTEATGTIPPIGGWGDTSTADRWRLTREVIRPIGGKAVQYPSTNLNCVEIMDAEGNMVQMITTEGAVSIS